MSSANRTRSEAFNSHLIRTARTSACCVDYGSAQHHVRSIRSRRFATKEARQAIREQRQRVNDLTGTTRLATARCHGEQGERMGNAVLWHKENKLEAETAAFEGSNHLRLPF